MPLVATTDVNPQLSSRHWLLDIPSLRLGWKLGSEQRQLARRRVEGPTVLWCGLCSSTKVIEGGTRPVAVSRLFPESKNFGRKSAPMWQPRHLSNCVLYIRVPPQVPKTRPRTFLRGPRKGPCLSFGILGPQIKAPQFREAPSELLMSSGRQTQRALPSQLLSPLCLLEVHP